MKKLFLGICASFIVFPLFAQQRIVVISDVQTRKALPGATVELSNGTSLLANPDGQVLLPAGASKLTVSHVGYRSQKMSFSGQDTIFLQALNLFLQPVEVKALRAGEKAPFARTNISAKDLEAQNLGQDLPFLLNQTPSVVVNSDAGNGVGYTGIRIRGSDATRINMTMNGIPYNDAESQGLFLVDLPDIASSVGSIQIQRGVGTSSNGAGAFGASLNLSTNEFHENPYGELNNSYGSFNTWKNTIKAGSGLIDNHFTIDARLSRITSDGYIDRSSSNLGSFYLSGAWLSEKSSLRFNIISGKEKTYQSWYGISKADLATCRTCNLAGTEKPGEPYANQTDNYQQDHYQLFFNHAFNDRLSLNLASFLTRGRGYYEEYKAAQAFSDYGLPNPVYRDTTLTTTDLVRQLWLDNYFYGGVYSLQYKNKGTQISFGGGLNRYDGRHYGKLVWGEVGVPVDHKYYDLDAWKTDVNFYSKWQQQLFGNWQSFVDLQYRRVRYDISGFEDNPTLFTSNTYNFFNPKAGLTYSKNNWTAYGSVALANKEPNRDDFEADREHQPKYESLTDYELGLEHKSSKSSWGANVYYMRYRNQLVLTGELNSVGAYTRTNIDRSYRLGIELQGSTRPLPWMLLSGNITLSENKVFDFKEYVDDYDNGGQKLNQFSKTDISFSPSLIAGATASVIPFKQAEISLIGKYVGRQYLDNTGNRDRSLDAFYVQDLRLRYTLKERFLRQVDFIFQLNNIFNRKYEPNGYTYSYIYNQQLTTENYVYPMAGINFMAGVNIRL